jgi:hypothetical protein
MNAEVLAICQQLGITPRAYRSRLESGWTEEKARSIPKHRGYRLGEKQNISQQVKRLGISRESYYGRLERGWTHEEALYTPRGEKPNRAHSDVNRLLRMWKR